MCSCETNQACFDQYMYAISFIQHTYTCTFMSVFGKHSFVSLRLQQCLEYNTTLADSARPVETIAWISARCNMELCVPGAVMDRDEGTVSPEQPGSPHRGQGEELHSGFDNSSMYEVY